MLKSEINAGAIAGNVSHEMLESAEWASAALEAIACMETKTPNFKGPLFPSLEDEEDDCDFSVYAYFVFTETEE